MSGENSIIIFFTNAIWHNRILKFLKNIKSTSLLIDEVIEDAIKNGFYRKSETDFLNSLLTHPIK